MKVKWSWLGIKDQVGAVLSLATCSWESGVLRIVLIAVFSLSCTIWIHDEISSRRDWQSHTCSYVSVSFPQVAQRQSEEYKSGRCRCSLTKVDSSSVKHLTWNDFLFDCAKEVDPSALETARSPWVNSQLTSCWRESCLTFCWRVELKILLKFLP